jgi:hypothetical protein
MNELMCATEVERLPDTDPSDFLTGPPASGEMFQPVVTERLLLLTGLAP